MAHNAINRARWRSVMAMQSFVTEVAHFNINGQNLLQAVNARNQFMNIERYFNENQSLGTKLWQSLFGPGGFFSNETFNDPGNEFQIHIDKLREQIQIVIDNNAICLRQLQLRIDNNRDANTGITAQQFNDGGAGGLEQGQSYKISYDACFLAIETIAEKNLEFLDYIGDGVGAAAQASRSIEEVLYFNSADISPFTAILHRLLNDQRQIVNAQQAQGLRDTLNSWMMFFEIPISHRLELFGNILSNPNGINSADVIEELQRKIRGYAMNSRIIIDNNEFNGAAVTPLVIDGINPYQEAWRLIEKAMADGIMRSDDPGVEEDFDDPTQPLRPKTALYCTLISFLTSGPSITVRLRLLNKHFEELLSSTAGSVNGDPVFVPIGGGDNPVRAPQAAVVRFAKFKKHMVRINALPQAALEDQNIPANHFRKNLSRCFETMFPSIIQGGNVHANLAQRITALEGVEDADYVQPNWANAWESSEEESDGGSSDSGGSGMDVEVEGGRRKRRKRTRRRKKRKKTRRKTRRKKRKKTRRKSKRRRKKRTRRK